MLTTVKTGALLQDAMAEASRLINLAIDDMLPASEGEDGKLMQSMRYGCLGGGKRLRPLLVFLALWFGGLFWGIAGIILATPTLVALKVVAENASGGEPLVNFLSPHARDPIDRP